MLVDVSSHNSIVSMTFNEIFRKFFIIRRASHYEIDEFVVEVPVIVIGTTSGGRLGRDLDRLAVLFEPGNPKCFSQHTGSCIDLYLPLAEIDRRVVIAQKCWRICLDLEHSWRFLKGNLIPLH